MRHLALPTLLLTFALTWMPPLRAADAPAEEKLVQATVERFWTALGTRDEAVLKSVLHSPFVMVGVSPAGGADASVTVQSAAELLRRLQKSPALKAKPSPVKVQIVGSSAAVATYTVTPEGTEAVLPVATMLAKSDGWRFTSTAVPALEGISRSQFTVNPTRFDPYKNFKFRVKWDGRYVAGVTKVSPLARLSEVVEARDGTDPSATRKSPGRVKFAPIILERGVTHDTEFEKWANLVWEMGTGLGAETALKNYRKDIIVELYNEAGQLVKAYKVYRCWVSRYQSLPELDANGEEVAIESITLENEGWERDKDVAEPAEPGKAVAPAK